MAWISRLISASSKMWRGEEGGCLSYIHTWLVLLRDLSNQTKHEEIVMESVRDLEARGDSLVSLPLPKPYTLYSWTVWLATEGEIGWEDSERIAEDWQRKNKSKWWESDRISITSSPPWRVSGLGSSPINI